MSAPCAQQGCPQPSVESGLCLGHALSRALRAQRLTGWIVRGVAVGGGVLLTILLLFVEELRALPGVRLGLVVAASAVLVVTLAPYLSACRAVARLTARAAARNE